MVSGKIKNNRLKFIFKKGYKATRYPFLVGIFLLQLILINQTAIAQSISLDQAWRTDLMRREQLLGRFDSTISFLINPVFLSNQNSISKIGNTNQSNSYLQKKGKSFF